MYNKRVEKEICDSNQVLKDFNTIKMNYSKILTDKDKCAVFNQIFSEAASIAATIESYQNIQQLLNEYLNLRNNVIGSQ